MTPSVRVAFAAFCLLIVAVVGAAYHVQFGPQASAKTAVDDMALALTAAQLNTPTRLSAAERDRQIGRCIVNAAKIEGSKRVYVGLAEDVARAMREGTRANCDCLINRVEDATTHLQFEQAMLTGFGFPAGFSRSMFSHGKPDRMEALLAQARSFGVSQRDFNVAAQETMKIIGSAGTYCMR